MKRATSTLEVPSEPASPVAEGEPGALSAIEQAETLRSVLRDTVAKSGDLIAALKRQKKQQQLMRDTLSSLKELQRLAG